MTQFSPPPYPPALPGAAPAAYVEKPWSGSAVAAFVLSWLGCTGVGAVLGIVFGVVGIAQTGGGQRRGRGLAIAAIPISLIMAGLAGVASFAAYTLYLSVSDMIEKMPAILGKGAVDADKAVSDLRSLSNTDFINAVSDDRLKGWFTLIRTKYGTLVDAQPDGSQWLSPTQPGRRELAVRIKAKFVNETAPLKIILDMSDFLHPRIHDLEIDGNSPRGQK